LQRGPEINASGVITVTAHRGVGDSEYDATDDTLLTLVFTAQEFTGTDQDVVIGIDSADMGAGEAKHIYVDSMTGDTIKVLGTTTVSGVVDLQGRDDDQGATVDPGAGVTYSMDPTAVTVGSWGTFSFSDLTDDTYPTVIDAHYYLKANGDVIVAGDDQSLGTIKLLGGDATDDEKVDVSDMCSIGGDYGKTSGFSPCNDVNIDGEVDILDLVLAAGNYDLSSSPWTWTP